MILSNWCVVTQFYYKIIAMDTFLLFQLHFTTRDFEDYFNALKEEQEEEQENDA